MPQKKASNDERKNCACPSREPPIVVNLYLFDKPPIVLNLYLWNKPSHFSEPLPKEQTLRVY